MGTDPDKEREGAPSLTSFARALNRPRMSSPLG